MIPTVTKGRWLDVYACPECRGGLTRHADRWTCTACRFGYPVRDGVPVLARRATEAPGFVGTMKRSYGDPKPFLEMVRQRGWQSALRTIQIAGEPDRVAEAVAPNRVSWRHVVGVTGASLVVDIGAGTGGVACQLAATCDVIAIDRSYVDAAFVAIRSAQSGLESLDSIVAEACQLPLANGVADVVTLIGVLEWVPVDFPDSNPRESQLAALREAKRVLKPYGRLYLAIENRHYFAYYLGFPEPHARLRYISLMDREASDRYSRETRGTPFLEWTYTLQEYLALLNEAGFAQVEPYWLYPNYRLPNALVPADHPAAARWFTEEFLDPRQYGSRMQRDLYTYLRFAPPAHMTHAVRDFGFVACST